MPFDIRPARPDHAAGIIALLRGVASEPVNNLLREPGEALFTVEQERNFLVDQALRPDWLGFVAFAEDGAVIGMITIDGKRRQAIRHCGVLGIIVDAAWRGQGVGRALMERAIQGARDTGIFTRIELTVLARNENAIRLYERLGFQTEGRHRRALLRNGEYLDELSMALLL